MSTIRRIVDKVIAAMTSGVPDPPGGTVPPDVDGRRAGDLDVRQASITAQLAVKGTVGAAGTIVGGEPMPEAPRD
ncbi:MAG TPA: hypothetical protein VES19_07865 [Candidatus Limnocylindrales bacterium]|nr:hypothetical protein [Candidatus Limnocylindrales bacterium]